MEELCAALGLCPPLCPLLSPRHPDALSLHFSLGAPPWDFETGLWQVPRSQGRGEGLMFRALTLGRGLAASPHAFCAGTPFPSGRTRTCPPHPHGAVACVPRDASPESPDLLQGLSPSRVCERPLSSAGGLPAPLLGLTLFQTRRWASRTLTSSPGPALSGKAPQPGLFAWGEMCPRLLGVEAESRNFRGVFVRCQYSGADCLRLSSVTVCVQTKMLTGVFCLHE